MHAFIYSYVNFQELNRVYQAILFTYGDGGNTNEFLATHQNFPPLYTVTTRAMY